MIIGWSLLTINEAWICQQVSQSHLICQGEVSAEIIEMVLEHAHKRSFLPTTS